MAHFIDEAHIEVQAGNGGKGCVAFRREKFVPRGGPSGGDGGVGGSVLVIGRANLNTLYHLKFPGLLKAENGKHGEGSDCSGRGGQDRVIEVPLGTVIYDQSDDSFRGELLADGDVVCVARGGRGGKGNAHFKTSSRQAPRFAQPGEEGEFAELRLELKLLADVGVVGLPNAGKSTFISVVTAAKPKIADYPFTTLVPQLGVVGAEVAGDPFVIADLPGLIAGAAQGAGLGHQFLRHVERCRVLVHLVDLSYGEQSAREDLLTIEKELGDFQEDLLKRPRILVGSKIDARDEDRALELRAIAEERGLPYYEISAVAHIGLDELIAGIGILLTENPAADADADADVEAGVEAESRKAAAVFGVDSGVES
jgi:GTP-binding protein